MRIGAVLAVTTAALLWSGAVFAACEDHIPQPPPQNTSRQDVGADYDTIIDRGWIDIAVYEDFPPFSYLEDGKLTGVDVEIARLIAEDLGVEARVRAVGAGETVDTDLRNWVWKGPLVSGRVANVLMHVPYDTDLGCRNEQAVLTGTYYVEKLGVAWDRGTYDEAPTPAYFRFDSVGVENDSLSDFYLSSAFGGQLKANVKRLPSYTDAMAALAAQEFGAVVGPLTQLQFGARKAESLSVSDVPMPGLSLGEWTLGVAVRHTYRQLGYAVDDAIQAGMQDGRIPAIFEEYGLTHRAPEW